MVLDDTHIVFSASSQDIKRPDLSFNIDIDQIILDRYLPPPTEKTSSSEKKSGQEPGKKTQKSDGDPVKQLRLDGRIKADQLTVKGIKARNVSEHPT